jgi:hypothetical protein
MTQTIAPPSSVVRRAPSGQAIGAPTRSRRRVPERAQVDAPVHRASARGRRRLDPLGGYTDVTGRTREVIAGRRGDGGVLVVDRDAATLGDRRLVAHLAPDEPIENAALVCAHYLADAHRGRCRRVTVEDLTGLLNVSEEPPWPLAAGGSHGTELVDRRGGEEVYRLEPVWSEGAVQLRWRRHSRRVCPAVPVSVCLREVVAAVESYEPACGLTLRGLAVHRRDREISVTVLRTELERLRESPIVLNRKLRQAVLSAIECQGLSMSEIAHRCGRIKRDAKGNASGETSWLARRVGVLPESGTTRGTPWVHSDVLALIARNGLGISPREVELG